jgi:hypothetical protein
VVLATSNSAAPAWVSYVSLGLAAVAILVSAGMSYSTWRRTGEVLSVRGDLRLPIFQGGGRRPARSGETFGVLTITAVNRGRTPVEIHSLWIASKDGKLRTRPMSLAPSSATLPVTIDARNRVQWYVAPETLGVLTKRRGNPLVVRPLIEWGPGNWTRGRVLRIRVGEEYLPGMGAHFKSTLGYRLRTLRRKHRLRPLQAEAMPVAISTTAPNDETPEPS